MSNLILVASLLFQAAGFRRALSVGPAEKLGIGHRGEFTAEQEEDRRDRYRRDADVLAWLAEAVTAGAPVNLGLLLAVRAHCSATADSLMAIMMPMPAATCPPSTGIGCASPVGAGKDVQCRAWAYPDCTGCPHQIIDDPMDGIEAEQPTGATLINCDNCGGHGHVGGCRACGAEPEDLRGVLAGPGTWPCSGVGRWRR